VVKMCHPSLWHEAIFIYWSAIVNNSVKPNKEDGSSLEITSTVLDDGAALLCDREYLKSYAPQALIVFMM